MSKKKPTKRKRIFINDDEELTVKISRGHYIEYDFKHDELWDIIINKLYGGNVVKEKTNQERI